MTSAPAVGAVPGAPFLAPARPTPAADAPVLLPNATSAAGATAAPGGASLNGRAVGANPFSFPSLLTNQGGATGAAYGGGGGALPRSLSSVSWLPALRQVPPVPLEWLRAFLMDLRPQQRHVSSSLVCWGAWSTRVAARLP